MAPSVPSAESIGIIGLGRMGRCLVQGLLEGQRFTRDRILFTTRGEESGRQVAEELGISRCRSNVDLVKRSSIVILAVKPQNVADVLAEIGPALPKKHTLISIVASVPTAYLEAHLPKGGSVLRVMPNTAAFVRASVTAVALGKSAQERDWERAAAIFGPLGKIVRVDERHMDAVTGLSGCGPAYFYVILEALTDAGIKVGLPRDIAGQMAAQTMLGAAQMFLQTGRHPAALKDEVTTPAGCTIDGLMELEEGKLRVTLIKAVVQATKRAKALAKLATGGG
jgi:pyrroline-5-carboxylate reductase